MGVGLERRDDLVVVGDLLRVIRRDQVRSGEIGRDRARSGEIGRDGALLRGVGADVHARLGSDPGVLEGGAGGGSLRRVL